MRSKYAVSSPFYETQQTWYLMPIVLREIPPHATDYRIILDPKFEYYPGKLSDSLYGTPAYWWVFQVRNMDVIRDPIWDMVAGVEIFAPSKTRLHELLG